MLNKVMSAPQNFPVMEVALPNVAGVPGYPMGHNSKSSSCNCLRAWELNNHHQFLPLPHQVHGLGDLLGGRKEEAVTSEGSETTVLESFDAPCPPSFEFEQAK